MFLCMRNSVRFLMYSSYVGSAAGGGDGGCAYQVAGAHTGMIGSHHSGVNYATWPPEREDGYTEHPNNLHKNDVVADARVKPHPMARGNAGKNADSIM